MSFNHLKYGLRRWLQWMFVLGLRCTGVLRRTREEARKANGILALTLHRVLEDQAFRDTNSPPGMVIRKETFRELCAYLRREYELVRLDSSGHRVSSRLKALVTFDDGWLDTYRVAYPIARQMQVPLIVFVCPALSDQASPFWPERIVASLKQRNGNRITSSDCEQALSPWKALSADERTARLDELSKEQVELSKWDRTMSIDQLSKMHANGVEFGSHTNTHQILTTVDNVTAIAELADSKAEMQRYLQQECDVIAYPNGSENDEVRRLTAQQGYRLAFTTDRGIWTEDSDLMAVPRCNLSEEDLTDPLGRFSSAMFEYTTLWKAWSADSAKRSKAGASGA